MPIYEYHCQNCAHEFETIQKVSDAPLTECPSCGEARLKKKISAVAFRLKGGGWYETDFKSGDKKKNVAGGDSGSESSTKTDSSSSDAPSTKSGDGAAAGTTDGAKPKKDGATKVEPTKKSAPKSD